MCGPALATIALLSVSLPDERQPTLLTVAVHAPTVTAHAPPCRLLSLSGGGSWGAWEAGVLQRLLDERGDAFDYARVLGVSAGSINAVFLATEPPGNAGLCAGAARLHELWAGLRTSDVWRFKSLIDRSKSLLSTAPLRRTLERTLNGRNVARNVTVGITSLATGEAVLVNEPEISRNNLVTLLLASSAIPVLFPPVSYNHSSSTSIYVDGGLVSNVLTVHGVERCLAGAPIEIDIINALPLLSPLAPAQVEKLGLVEIALRSVQVLIQTAMTHQLNNFKCNPGQRSNVLARVFAPRAGLGLVLPTLLDFDHGEWLWRAGYDQSAAPQEFFFCV
ncbi:acyl transferase/acyl hydrolase/lysophospholipase [Pavlovales sp. CCMP2436]|nr:acyl transferase/acyl hydrolase/lysophospholipase [Pavlovales sp. CCMP2436]|mmetsp:Transcript_5172/g.13492  ORF Transcript_5172/g.13492 Transcript_5172/m.13492 type:complete len:334 (+) Transcript_5172:145-1146(+)